AVTTPAAATAAFLPRPGFIDRQGPAIDLFAVERLNGRLSFCVAAHLHEAESLRPAGIPVHNHLCRLHGAVRLAELAQSAVGHAVGQVAYVQLLGHVGPPKKEKTGSPPPRLRPRLTRKRDFLGQEKGREEAVTTTAPFARPN